MDSFYFIVLSIATVILILLLIILGVLMSYSKNKITHPPSYSKCPDYWTLDTTDNKSCAIPVNSSTDTTKFNIPSTGYNNINNTPGYTSTKIDFTDGGWKTRSKTRECAIKDWTNKYGVEWDGISNFNGC